MQVAEKAKQAELPLGASPGAKSIAATIAEDLGDVFIINCQRADGELKIRMPKSLIPEGLRVYGKPVTLSLTYLDGIRVPSVVARQTNVPSTVTAEMQGWVDSL